MKESKARVCEDLIDAGREGALDGDTNIKQYSVSDLHNTQLSTNTSHRTVLRGD